MPDSDFLELLKSRVDIADVIGSYVQLKRAGANFKGLCPFHQEKTPSFQVNPAKGVYYCFGCHKGGDVISFVMEYERTDFMGAVKLLAQQAGLRVPESSRFGGGPHGDGPNTERLYELHDRLAKWFRDNLSAPCGAGARQYLLERGVQPEMVAAFGLGYAPGGWENIARWGHQLGYSPEFMAEAGVLLSTDRPEGGKRYYDLWRNRLMFPIWNPQGRVVGFSGRKLDPEDKGGKYVNSPETPIFHKSNVLYALPLARQSLIDRKTAILCEGQLDVIACHTAGLTNAVAPQGTAFTEGQAKLLGRFVERLVLAFDADNAGINAALKAGEVFIPAGLSASVVLVDEGEDPDSLLRQQGPEILRQRFAQAQDYFLFLLERLLQREENPALPEAKARVARQVLEMVARLDNAVARGQYCQQIAARLEVPQSFAFEEMNAIRNRHLRQGQLREAQAQARAPALPPAPPLFEDPQSRAETVLLDLALHHQSYAQRLLDELPPDEISQSEAGRALNEVLGHTAQGAWEESEAALRARMATSPLVSRVLIEPEFADPGLAADKLETAYRDCLQRLAAHSLKRRMEELQTRLTSAASPEERRTLLLQLTELQRRRGPARPR